MMVRIRSSALATSMGKEKRKKKRMKDDVKEVEEKDEMEK
jgi:hypothetical protein